MESTPLQQDLAEAERAAAAPYVDYPPTPRWYPPAVGLWVACLVAALTLLDDHPMLRVAALLALVALEAGFIGWYRRYRATMPSLRHPPAEIRREMRWYWVGLTVVVAAVVGTALLSQVAAVAVALVLVTAGATVYERRYARAAAQTRARLG